MMAKRWVTSKITNSFGTEILKIINQSKSSLTKQISTFPQPSLTTAGSLMTRPRLVICLIHFSLIYLQLLTLATCSKTFIADVFRKLKVEEKLSTTKFSFVPTTSTIVEKLILKLDNASSPGLSGIPTKILKAA